MRKLVYTLCVVIAIGTLAGCKKDDMNKPRSQAMEYIEYGETKYLNANRVNITPYPDDVTKVRDIEIKCTRGNRVRIRLSDNVRRVNASEFSCSYNYNSIDMVDITSNYFEPMYGETSCKVNVYVYPDEWINDEYYEAVIQYEIDFSQQGAEGDDRSFRTYQSFALRPRYELFIDRADDLYLSPYNKLGEQI